MTRDADTTREVLQTKTQYTQSDFIFSCTPPPSSLSPPVLVFPTYPSKTISVKRTCGNGPSHPQGGRRGGPGPLPPCLLRPSTPVTPDFCHPLSLTIPVPGFEIGRRRVGSLEVGNLKSSRVTPGSTGPRTSAGLTKDVSGNLTGSLKRRTDTESDCVRHRPGYYPVCPVVGVSCRPSVRLGGVRPLRNVPTQSRPRPRTRGAETRGCTLGGCRSYGTKVVHPPVWTGGA